MKKITILIIITAFSICAQAQNFMGIYTFDSVKTTTGTTDPSFVPTATGVTFGSFTATGTPINPNAMSRFSFTNWPTGSTGGIADSLYSGMTGSLSATEYFEVTISPNAGYSITLDTIRFTARRSSTGPRSYSVRSSADGFTTNILNSFLTASSWISSQGTNEFFYNHDTSSNTYNNINGNLILLTGGSFNALANPITFRFYAWNAEASGGSFGIDNVSINGTATIATSIKENKKTDLIVYPNPSANGLFTFDLGAVTGKTIITVYDIIGNEILSKEINSGNKQTIDLSNQANGSYFIKIKNNNSISTRKIIICK